MRDEPSSDSGRNRARVSVLLFDIGGVLLDNLRPKRLHALIDERVSLSEVVARWPLSPALRQFETGNATAEEFARAFVEEWELSIAHDVFLHEFSSWARAPLPGALELLHALQGFARLACLTNMNAAYWARIRDDMGFGEMLERCYASHEIGMLKPDRAIYAHVIDDLGCEAQEIAFFDDTEANVIAAERLGMQAFHVDGVVALERAVHALGI